MIERVLAAVLLLSSAFALPGCAEELPEQPAEIEFDLSFVARWWSEDQMEDLDLNDPPPKLAEITLRRWEASDPVGTPHPEEFDVVGVVKTSSGLSGIRIEIERRWGIGDLYGGESTRWTDWALEGQTGPIDLVAGANRIRLARVRLDAIQQELYNKGEWPWVFEARARLTTSDEAALNIVTSRKLEIYAGD